MDIIPQLFVNSLITGSIYALASVGLSLAYGLLRLLNFAHGHLMMLGAYFFYAAHIGLGMPLISSAAVVILAGTVVAILSFRIFISPFTSYSYVLPFVTTLVLATIIESLVAMIWGVNVKSLAVDIAMDSHEIWGTYITDIQIIIILSALGLLGLVAFIIHSTAIGRRIQALSQHGPAAEALGLNRSAIVMGVFLASALLAMYAGILVGYETNIQPTMGNSYTIKAFAAMVLGGLGNVWGTVAGSFVLGLVENFSIGLDFGGFSLPAGYKDAFAFVIILTVLLWRPEGLFKRQGRKN